MSRPECKNCPLDNTTCTFPACPHLEKTRKMKYTACQQCRHNGLRSCDPECMEEMIKREKPRSPADRIMTTIRDEVSALIVDAKLAGYRQAQREEFDFWKENNYFAGSKITERIMHLRKELGL